MKIGIDLDEAAGAGRREQLAPVGHQGWRNPSQTSSPSGCLVFQWHFWLVTLGRELGQALALPKHSQEFPPPFVLDFGAPKLKSTSPGSPEGF